MSNAPLAWLGGLLLFAVLSVSLRRRRPVLLTGGILVGLSSGLWLAQLGRPYGLLADPIVTERMATASTVAATGTAAETCFAGEANANALRDGVLARLKPEPLTVAWLFSAIPALLVPIVALAFHTHRQSNASSLSGLAVLLFWPAGAQLLPRWGLLPPFSYWGDPWGALGLTLLVIGFLWIERGVGSGFPRLFPGVLALVLATIADPGLGTALGAAFLAALLLTRLAGRGRSSRLCVALGLGLTSFAFFVWLGWLSMPSAMSEPMPAWKLLGWALLGQPLWVGLTVYAVATQPLDSSRLHWLLTGSILLLACAAGVNEVPLIPTLALYRLGLILGAAPGLVSVIERLRPGSTLDRIPRWTRAAMVLLVGALSPLGSYRPDRLDSRYVLSMPPISDAYTRAATWIFEHTPPESVFIADGEMAPLIATFGGRRLLRADGLVERQDEAARANVEARIVGGRRPDRVLEAARRFGVTHVAVSRTAQTPYALRPEDFEGRAPFRKVYQSGDWFYVFALEGPDPSAR